MKIIISKQKRDKIESMIFGLTGAIAMIAVQEGRVTDGILHIREIHTKEIMDILDNK